MAPQPWLPSLALAAAVANKDLPDLPVPPAMTVKPVWTVSTDMTANTAEMGKYSARLFHRSHALSALQDLLDPKANPETKDPADPKERTERTAKMETQAHKEWPDHPETKAPSDLPDHPDPKERRDASTKSMDQLAPTALPAHPEALDPKANPEWMESPDHPATKARKEKPARLEEKVCPVLPDHPVNPDHLAKLALATTAQHRELHQAIKLHRTHGTRSKTLILGASSLLQETVLLFDNAQFLCFIFFVIWQTTR
jgi:hypothetical protein